jgi:hypothetical protein
MNFDLEEYKYMAYVFAAFAMFLWLVIVVVGFSFFARCAFTSGERFRLSFGFALASIFCPPFACVPIALNVR